MSSPNLITRLRRLTQIEMGTDVRRVWAGIAGTGIVSIPLAFVTSYGLGAAGRGEWAVAVQLAFFGELLFAFGTSTTVLVHADLAAGQKINTRLIRVIARRSLATVPFSIIWCGVLAGFVYDLGPATTVLSMLAIPLLVAGRLYMHLALRLGGSEIFRDAPILQSVAQLVLMIGSLIVIGLTVPIALTCFLIGAVIRLGATLIWLKPLIGNTINGDVRVRGSTMYLISEVGEAAQTRLLIVLLPLVLPFSVVGVISLAVAALEFALIGPHAIGVIAVRDTKDAASKDDRFRPVRTAAVVGFAGMVVMVLLGIALEMVPLSGDFESLPTAVMWMSICVAPAAVARALVGVTVGSGQGTVAAPAQAIFAACVVAILPVIDRHAEAGSALALTVGSSVMAIYLWFMLRRSEASDPLAPGTTKSETPGSPPE